MTEIQHNVHQKTVQDVVYLFKNKQLNLSPGFQRDSVWSDRDRAKLIDSILRRWPIPAVFFYKRHTKGDLVYDVIDGKQRLESIPRFIGEIRGCRFKTRVQFPGSSSLSC
ncbi:MAG: DUF262 domain-containing protein [Kiritimatiellia bacterium]